MHIAFSKLTLRQERRTDGWRRVLIKITRGESEN